MVTIFLKKKTIQFFWFERFWRTELWFEKGAGGSGRPLEKGAKKKKKKSKGWYHLVAKHGRRRGEKKKVINTREGDNAKKTAPRRPAPEGVALPPRKRYERKI